jgi:O-acetyl-ADP-ribose deacetylase (regulator of RNase III)/uncharacterized protein YwgA
MTLRFKSGDMFKERADALVNTVNSVGVMGKGVALEFKRRWPENFEVYRKACAANEVAPGKMLVFDRGGLVTDGPRYLVNFPTKTHWRSKSKLSYVEEGLDDLARVIRDYSISSLVMPPPGCGNGGLDWADVKPLIEKKLGQLPDVEVIVFAPKIENEAPEYLPTQFSMTFERAILLKALNELELYFDGSFDRISLQKVAYFLQAMGVNFGLKFAKNLHGPYSEPLKKAYLSFEKYGLIDGFLAGERQTHVTRRGYAMAEDFLSKQTPDGSETVLRLIHLVQGYESAYGLELLSSVHWLAHHEQHFPVERIVSALQDWSDHKRSSFTEDAIRIAYARLVEDKLLN